MSDLRSIEERLSSIEERNRRVEADKAWETSWTRRLLIAVLTYGVIAVYLQAILESTGLTAEGLAKLL